MIVAEIDQKVAHSATILARPVASNDLMSSAPRFPMPIQARRTFCPAAPTNILGANAASVLVARTPFKKERRRIADNELELRDVFFKKFVSC